MIIVISQFKLLQRETSVCGCCTQVTEALLQHFTNTLKWWFVVWSDGSAVVSIHCCITIAAVYLLNTSTKSSVCNLRKLKAQCLCLDQNYRPAALLHNHRMCNAHMCTLAIVMATCSYWIYFWRRAVIAYSLVLLLFRLGCSWLANLLQATWWKRRKSLLSAWQS